MKVICEYCNGYMDDTDEKCPNCGATNPHLVRSADGVPKTIDELKAFAVAKNIPLSQMRFFIGIDLREPRAYGIYRDEEGNFIVYKNKANGARTVRYKGKDQAYAVNEIYQKLRTEISEQNVYQSRNEGNTQQYYQSQDENKVQQHQQSRDTYQKSYGRTPNISNDKASNRVGVIIFIIIAVIVFSGVLGGIYSAFSHSYHSSFYYDDSWDSDYSDDYDYWDDDDSWSDDWSDEWSDDWDGDDWDIDYDWDDSYSDWDSDW